MPFDDKEKTERLNKVRAEIARRLKLLRADKRSAAEVSRAIRKDRGVVGLMEKGRINALDTLCDLLWEYGIGVDDFLVSFTQQNVQEEMKDDQAKLKAILNSNQTARKNLVHLAIDDAYREVQEVKARLQKSTQAKSSPVSKRPKSTESPPRPAKKERASSE